MNKILKGNEIKQIRNTLGLTQRAFADILGITYPYLSDLEREKKSPSQQLVNLILTKNKPAVPASSPTEADPMVKIMNLLLEECRDLKKRMETLEAKVFDSKHPEAVRVKTKKKVSAGQAPAATVKVAGSSG